MSDGSSALSGDDGLASTAWAVDPLLDAVIGGRYRIKEILGRGGMGVVYGAVHEELGREVAIKVVSAKFADEPRVIDRFLREAKTVAQIGHPNIVDVHDLGRLEDRRPYLVMERLYGSNFQELLSQQGRMEPARVAELLEGAGAALEVVHAKGIIHRDIKPENLMLARTADGASIVKLLDFGIARMANLAPDAPRITAANMIAGTPLYIAPEGACGEVLDHRADIYSLAVVAYHLLAGRAPFEGGTPIVVLTRKLHEVPPPLSVTAGVPFAEALEEVLARGLARRPEDRYASARALVRDIRAAAGAQVETMLVRSAASRAGASAARGLGAAPSPAGRAMRDVQSPAAGEAKAQIRTSAEIAVALGDPRQRRRRRVGYVGAALLAVAGGAIALRSGAGPGTPSREAAGRGAAVEAVAPAWHAEGVEGVEAGAPVRRAPASSPGVGPAPAAGHAPAVDPTPARDPTAGRDPATPIAQAPAPGTDSPQPAAAPAAEESASEGAEHGSGAGEPSTEPPGAPRIGAVKKARTVRSHSGRAKRRRGVDAEPAHQAMPEPPAEPAPSEPAVTAPELDPDRARLATKAGMRALVTGLLPAAIERFHEATRAAPRHAPAWRGLGLANERVGRKNEAIAAYKRYLSLAAGDDPALVREVEKRVELLER